MAGSGEKREVYKDKRGEWRWRILDGDGQVIGAASEGYNARADAEKNMNRGAVPTDKWEFYQDKRGAWRWRRFAQNGQQVGRACRGFASRAEAEANARRLGYTG